MIRLGHAWVEGSQLFLVTRRITTANPGKTIYTYSGSRNVPRDRGNCFDLGSVPLGVKKTYAIFNFLSNHIFHNFWLARRPTWMNLQQWPAFECRNYGEQQYRAVNHCSVHDVIMSVVVLLVFSRLLNCSVIVYLVLRRCFYERNHVALVKDAKTHRKENLDRTDWAWLFSCILRHPATERMKPIVWCPVKHFRSFQVTISRWGEGEFKPLKYATE